MLWFALLVFWVWSVQGEHEQVQVELDAARQLWASKRTNDYEFTVERSGFLPNCLLEPRRVQVSGDVVTNVHYVGNPTDSDGQLCAERYPLEAAYESSIEGLFDAIQRMIDLPAAELRTDFDAALGNPTSMYADPSEEIADEEIAYTLWDVYLEPMESTRGPKGKWKGKGKGNGKGKGKHI